MTAELFDALTEMLAVIFEKNLRYARADAPIREQYLAGVSRVLKVTEALEPTYENRAARALEITYLDRDGVERIHYLWEITLWELLRGKDVRVPDHKLTWTLEAS